jgi:D-alanyl-D-alanine dipeptidase
MPPSEPLKKEGDGRAPAGIFRLTTAFGFASRLGPHASLPFTQITPAVECVDDQNSRFYNRIVKRTNVAVDWKSSEQMSAYGAQYKWGIVVDYNSAPSIAGAGSCIFLHVWSGAGHGTAGCTAMPETNITKLIDWLSPQKHPVLVQMPRTAFSRYGAAMRLPPLF